jgi:hypothetical protein
LSTRVIDLQRSAETVQDNLELHRHFFLPFALLFGAGAGVEALDKTLEAREDGAADVALLPTADLTLSKALFYLAVS